MLRFSANLSTLFQELPLIDRFAAAAAWFKGIELWFPYEIDAKVLAGVLDANDLVCVGMNSPPGNVKRTEIGAPPPTRLARTNFSTVWKLPWRMRKNRLPECACYGGSHSSWTTRRGCVAYV